PRLSSAGCAELDRAVGVWISQLRVVLIDAAHHALAALDQLNYEMMLARTAWHEWAHALSVDRAEADRRSEYTHEIVAEVYALLMLRRRYGARGQPTWLRDEIYHLVRRVSGWNE
ncbi:MAG: hypothetical protein QOD83_4089, partial [Solirubrobacteraceae bacterium]|nr:hypothetical protein [Solirubrobacteraceae bacterium]